MNRATGATVVGKRIVSSSRLVFGIVAVRMARTGPKSRRYVFL
jgi:hypothetical protein